MSRDAIWYLIIILLGLVVIGALYAGDLTKSGANGLLVGFGVGFFAGWYWQKGRCHD